VILAMNVVEPIFVQCRDKPAELALCAPGTNLNLVSYARLARLVDSVCWRVISAGLAPGNRVAVFIQDPLIHALILIALMRLGIVSVSGKNRGFFWPFEVNAVIADTAFAYRTHRTILTDASWVSGEDRPLANEHIHRGSPDEVCRIILTSGTTGEDKAVEVTNRMMAARIERQYMFFGPQAGFCSRTYVDLGWQPHLVFNC